MVRGQGGRTGERAVPRLRQGLCSGRAAVLTEGKARDSFRLHATATNVDLATGGPWHPRTA